MKRIYIKFIFCSVLFSALSLHSCTLEEYNPGAFTKEALATSIDGYETLINQCYFAMERFYYGSADWMSLTEGDTDLWTYKANESTSYTQWFWFFAGTSPNTTYTNNWWNGTYDGVGACNEAIALGDKPPYTTEEERNAKIAEARFLRAVYYFNAVEQFGAVTMLTEPITAETLTYSPTRTDPMTIYQEVILPDLRFASEWLPTGTHATTTTPTKKAALGFLAKACLQTYEYGSTEYLQEALDTAKKLITDCETGGGKYNTYMYPSYSEVFKESNNWENKEALWKHRWYAGADGHGSSNGNYKLNRNDEYFLCNINKFGEDNQETRLTWEGSITGIFMPTQHLLSLYIQKDGTLDPRFHESFTTEWNANKNYTWDESAVHMYDKEETVIGKALNKGDLAIKFIMPQDIDYATEKQKEHISDYLLIDYHHVYSNDNNNVNMNYAYTNVTGNYKDDGTNENQFRYYYPSLNKHNSSNYYVANASKQRNGNLNATFIMRMAEVYLIAAEASVRLNKGDAAKYINVLRTRAGAGTVSESQVDLNYVFDEYARELCGECGRWYLLKRNAAFETRLAAYNKRAAEHFKKEFYLRPIPTKYLDAINNPAEFGQNAGY